jgi:multidrug efflux pump subunit AcrB/nucleotide-binding universal stress UspA family protein
MTRSYGVAGRLAAAFIESKLTPLFLIAALALGLLSVIGLPREEEPQIIVPMIDVMVQMPGASPAEVEQRVTRPMEKLLWEIPGVEYIYSTSAPGMSMVIVRFYVGQDEEQAIVRLNQKLYANADIIPPGVSPPIVKPRSIDDVPVMALTLWGARYNDFELRRVAEQLHDVIKEVPDVSEVTIAGGRGRQVTVEIDPARLASYNLDPLAVQRAIQASNLRLKAGELVAGGRSTIVEAGSWIDSVERLKATVVDARTGSPVWLRDVATVRDGDAEPTTYVAHHAPDGRTYPAVTISIAKRKGVNAIELTRRISEKIDTVRGVVIPGDLQVSVTRNYGETAAHKSNELLWHMFIAIVSVSILIWLTLGRREAAVVAVAIPVTLALTLFVFFIYGYTLNRITLFALIFSIGILVDDAIVVVENIVRHARIAGKTPGGMAAVAVRAVDEVGNPTILATLTVIAAILPMAFVGGLMGPYMRPIPVGATAAMIFSLIVAFIATPWAARRLLAKPGQSHHGGEDRLTRAYRRWMSRLIAEPGLRVVFLASVAVLLLIAVALVPLGLVTVKMLPFDDKSEFQVVINMPEGTPLEDTARVASELATAAMKQESVTSVQSYVGTASPYNFNGLVRHYFMRRAANQADLQVNLTPKEERSEQSHAIAKRVRVALAPIAAKAGARVQVAEVPPGPPVLQTLVAEVYGPDPARRQEVARQVKDILTKTDGVVDVDWYVEAPQPKVSLDVDQDKAAAVGVPTAAIAALVRMGGAGDRAGILHDDQARADVPIVLQLPRSHRGSLDSLRTMRINGVRPIAVGEVARVYESTEPPSVYHKNLQPVTYVLGDVAGRFESPVYAILQLNGALKSMKLPEGYRFEIFNAAQPFDSTKYAMKWDGEWHITYEVFRDLGLAFAAALLLIYILVVGWFQSFLTPVIIMVSIPFSLIGILPAHAAMGAFFTATSMIGFIAGAGIVVRNSIILVDFIELRVREGMPLAEAVVDAGAVRFRPIALTAAAVVVGAVVILFDPIFQGLAISLMAGSVVSVFLAPATVPVLTYLTARRTGLAAAHAPATTPEAPQHKEMWASPPRRILVAVDFGDASIRALRVAQSVATRHGASITALHAETIDVPPYFTHEQLGKVERHHAADRRDAEAYLAAFVAQHAPSATARLVEGQAVPMLVSAATGHDLIVLGTHGRRGPTRWWMGSVAERVVRETPIPALVVRAGQDQTDDDALFARPIVVDGPEPNGDVRHYADTLASAFGGVVGEKTVASISDLACSPDATLMAVGIGRHDGQSWFGEAAEKLVRQCQLPMLFVPTRS